MANKINFEVGFITNSKGLKELKSELAEIRAMANNMDFTSGLEPSKIQAMVKSANDLEYAMNAAFDVDLNTVNIQKFQQILKQSGTDLKQIQQGLATAGTTGQSAFLKATAGLMQFNTAAKQTNKFLDSIATSFANTIKWSAMSSIVNTITGTIQKSYYYVKDLDSALNDIRIVTGKNADEMSRFAESANDAAKALAVTTEDYTQGSLIYYQQGLDDETVKALTDITAKTSNVTGQSMSAVSEELTAVWNGYQVANQAAQEGMQVYEEYVDKMAAVGASTASDLEELSKAMSKVASAASSMGIDFDDLNAQIATIVSVTRQAPESVGTALKTIYARLGDLKVDGVDEFGVKLGEVSAQLNQMGIEVLDQNGNLRDMTPVMAEVAEKWNTWTEAQRQAAAVAMAGKRQYNNLIALFDNWDMYGDALKTSMEAAGTLEEQQEIALDSLSNKMDQLKATAEDLYDSLYDEGDIKDLVEGLTGIVQGLADFSDSIGGLINLLPMLGATGLRVFNDQIAKGLSTVVINTRNAINANSILQENYNALASMFSGSILFSESNPSGAMAQGVQNLMQYYNEMQKYAGIMSQDQKENYNTILNNIAKVGELNVEIEQTTKNWDKSKDYLKLIGEELRNDKEKVDELSVKVSEIKTVEKQLSDYSLLGEFKNADDLLKQLQSDIQNLDPKIVEQLRNEFDRLNDKEIDVDKALTFIIEKLKETGNAGASLAEVRQQVNILSSSTEQAGKALKDNLNIQKLFADISSGIGTMGQWTMSLKTLGEAFASFKDNSMTGMEKLEKSIMALSFSLPGLINGSNKLISLIKAQAKVSEVAALQTSMETAANKANTLSISAKAAAEKAESLIKKGWSQQQKEDVLLISKEIAETEIDTTALKKNSLERQFNTKISNSQFVAIKKNIIALREESAAQLAQNEVIEKQIALQEAQNIAMTANPVGLVITAIAAVTAVIYGVIKAYSVYNEKIKENAQTELDSLKVKEEELNKNEELYQSYHKLKKDFDDGIDNKEELRKATEDLCKVYDIEVSKLDLLAGKYSEVNAKINEKRQKALEEEKSNLTSQLSDQAIIAEQTAKEGTGRKYGDRYKAEFSSKNIFTSNDFILQNSLKSNLGDYWSDINTGLDIKYGNMDELVEAYHRVEKAQKDYIANTTEKQRAESADYKVLTEWLSRNGEQIKTYEEIQEKIKDVNTESVLLNHNFSKIDSLEKYNQEVKKVINELVNLKDENGKLIYTQEEAIKLAKEHAASMTNATESFAKQADIISEVAKEVGQSEDEVQKFINGLSEEQREIIFSGQVDIDHLGSLENIKKAIELIQGQINREDLSIVVSLRDKVTSDKKLNKKQIQEMMGEESNLANDYEVQMADFDMEAQIDQVDILNGIVRDKLELDKQWIENTAEMAQAEIELEEIRKAELEKEINSLEARKKSLEIKKEHIELTKEEEEELKSISSELDVYADSLENVENNIEHLQELIEKGFTPDEISATIFDDMIAGIDGVISKADVLKDLVSVVGENWTLAAGKVEEFAQNFPEVLRYQENYNTLQDGSIQLTEKGKQVLQEELGIKKQELIAENEAYQEQLQQQADLLYMEAEYYQAQADNLADYLQGRKTGAQTEADLEKELRNYEQKIADATGQKLTDVQNAVRQEYGITDEQARGNTEDIYNYWCSVGAAAAAAGQAYDAKQFTPPGFNQGANVGTRKTSYNVRDTGQETELFKAENVEQIVELQEELQKRAESARNRADILISKKAASASAAQASINAIDNAASGKGNDKSSKSSKSSQKEHKDDEPDRYWEINKALNEIDRTLKKLDKIKSHVFGKQKIQVLKQEANVIKQQTQLYEKLYEEQKKEAEELRGKLSAGGMTFSAEGEITNYGTALKNALASYNTAVDQFNAGLMDETAFKVAEQNYEKFKKNVDRYDKLFYTEMKDTREKIEDEVQKLRDINLETFEIKLQVKIDKAQLKKDFRNFRKELKKDFTLEYEILPKTKKFRKDFKNDKSQVKAYMAAAKEVQDEIDIIMAGGTSKVFASLSEAQEKLKEINKDFEEASRNAMQDVEDAWENYISMIDQANEKIVQQEEILERVNTKLESFRQIAELAFGAKAYEEFGKIFEQQLYNNQAQIEATMTEVETYQKLFEDQIKIEGANRNDMSTWSEAATEYYNTWQDYEQKINDLTYDRLSLLKDQYLNTLDQINDDLEKQLTTITQIDENGKEFTISVGFDIADQEWELAEKQADLYYNSTEKAYQIQTLNNKIQKDIDKSSLSSQKKLQAFRDEQLTALGKETVLSKYEMDVAQAKYEILQKQIALEESRNNKSSMKLRRNSEGNWSYQYVADENDIKDKEQDLLDSWENLRKLSQEQMNQTSKDLQTYQKMANDASIENEKRYAEGLITKEQYEYTKKMIEEKYYKKPTGILWVLGENYQKAKEDLILGEVGVRQEVYRQDEGNYQDFNDTEKGILDKFVEYTKSDYLSIEKAVKDNYANIDKETIARFGAEGSTYSTWNTAANQMADKWSNDKTGVQAIIKESLTKMGQATTNYKTEVDKTVKQVGLDWDSMKTKIDGTKTETDLAKTAIINYCKTATEQLPNAAKQVEKLKTAWGNLSTNISNASKEIEKYLKKQKKIKKSDDVGVVDTTPATTIDTTPVADTTTTDTTPVISTIPKTTSPPTTTTTIDINKKAIQQHYVKDLGIMYDTAENFWKIRKISDSGTPGSWHKAFSGVMYPSDEYDTTTMLKIAKVKYKTWLGQPCSYDTGGYTGNWNNNGRLAMLHQKELVLNAQDTENFLAATNSLRDLVSLDSSIENSIVEAISKMMLQISSKYGNNMQSASTANNTNNTFNITAEFPNANDVNDIREAILSLPNIASQYISKQRI